jgi:hypothetical protein
VKEDWVELECMLLLRMLELLAVLEFEFLNEKLPPPFSSSSKAGVITSSIS